MKRILALSVAAALLAACAPAPPTATPTSSATETPSATATRTPVPSRTPTPSLAPGEVRFENRIHMEYGYSFEYPVGYNYEIIDNSTVLLENEEGFRIALQVRQPSSLYPSDRGDWYEEVITENLDFELDNVRIDTYTEREVWIWTFFREIEESDFIGEYASLLLENGREIIALAVFRQEDYSQGLIGEGREVVDGILGSLAFEQFTSAGGACQIHSDSNYGYTEAQPIPLGGQDIANDRLAILYFSVLRDSDGQSIRYDQIDRIGSGQDSITVYEVVAGQTTRTLYVDHWTYGNVYAPVGFECYGVFLQNTP